MKRRWLPLLLLCFPGFAADSDDAILRAMRAEVERARGLKFAGLESPYYVEANVNDLTGYSVSATLGGIVGANGSHSRTPEVQVRVGDYKFDNTNYVGTEANYGSNYDVDRLPLEDNYDLLRRYLWLAIDRSYKSAVEAISRKRAALRNITTGEQPDDFAKAPPLKMVEPVAPATFPEEALKTEIRKLSAIFAKYPDLRTSSVEYSGIHNIQYMVNTEGTELRLQEHINTVRARAAIRRQDGMMLRDAVVFHSGKPGALPTEEQMTRAITQLAENVSALAKAPVGQAYNGPVLFEREAAAQIFAQVIGRNLALTRRPVMESNRPGAFASSELEGRFGARILPEWMDIVDDPTQTQWRGNPLFGHYTVDADGVAPKPLALVEKGRPQEFSAHAPADARLQRLQRPGAPGGQLRSECGRVRESVRQCVGDRSAGRVEAEVDRDLQDARQAVRNPHSEDGLSVFGLVRRNTAADDWRRLRWIVAAGLDSDSRLSRLSGRP